MTATNLSLPGDACYLSQEPGRWLWRFVQPRRSEYSARAHILPGSILADECLPLRSSDWHEEDLEGPGSPIGFLVSELPVLVCFSPSYFPTHYISSYSL